MTDKRFPLSWPVGWPRLQQQPKRSQFKIASIFNAWRLIEQEVRLLRGVELIISTNIPLRKDGLPYGQGDPEDVGAAVYFKLDGRDIAFACDKWETVGENLYAIGRHIEAMRAQERWGVGRRDQAFQGYKLLPGENWWDVLQCSPQSKKTEVKKKYLELIAKHHPDRGGNTQDAARINAAYQNFIMDEKLDE